MKLISFVPKEDAKLFYLFYRIGNGGVTPWYNFQNKSMRKSKFYTVCKLLWLAIYFYGLMLTVLFHNEQKDFGWTAMKTLNTVFGILKCCCMLNYIFCLLFKKEMWTRFLGSFFYLHEELRTRNVLTENFVSTLSLCVMFLCVTAYVLCVITYFLIMNFNENSIVMVFVLFYCFVLDNSLICLACICLKRRYRDLNRYLERSVGGLSRSTDAMLNDYLSATNVRYAGKIYKKLGDLVDMCNSLFGWKIMFALSISFFKLLETIGSVLRGSYWLTTSGFYLMIIMSVSLSVVLSCDGITVEGRKIGSLCCELQERHGVHAMEKEELQKLANMAELHTPTMTGGGLFDVNRKTVLALVSTATMYMIVIAQLETGQRQF